MKKNEYEFQLKSDMKWHRVNKFTSIYLSISLTHSILYHCYKTYISYFTDLSFQSFFLLHMYVYVMYFMMSSQTKLNRKKRVPVNVLQSSSYTLCAEYTLHMFLLFYCLFTYYAYSSYSLVLEFMLRHKGNDEIKF